MITPDTLDALFERIKNGQTTEADINTLHQWLAVDTERRTLQLGKYNINIGLGQEIQIGDTVYQGADAETIKALLQDVLQEYQLLPEQKKSSTKFGDTCIRFEVMKVLLMHSNCSWINRL
jgi:hypothetical protein